VSFPRIPEGLGRKAGIPGPNLIGSSFAVPALVRRRSIFYRRGKFDKTEVESACYALDCRPTRICLAALDTREPRARDVGIVGEFFLRAPAAVPQPA